MSTIEHLIKNAEEIKKLFFKRYDNDIELKEKFGLQYLSSGADKTVYIHENLPDIVIKLSRHAFGLKEEKYYKCSPQFFPKVYYADNNMVIAEKVTLDHQNIDKALSYFGIDIKKLKFLVESYGHVGNYFDSIKRNDKKFILVDIMNLFVNYKMIIARYKFSNSTVQPIYEYLLNLPKLREFLITAKKCNFSLSDMHAANFGFRADGQFVIIDIYPDDNFDYSQINLETVLYGENK